MRIHAEREGIERPLEREANLRRASELVFGRRGVQGRAGNPRHKRIEHAQAVGVEIEDKRALVGPPPSHRAAPVRDQSGLLHAQRIHLHSPIGEMHGGGAAVDDRPGEQRRSERSGKGPDRRRYAVALDTARCREGEARRRAIAYHPALQVHVLCVQRELACAVDRQTVGRAEHERAVTAHRAATTEHRDVGVRVERGQIAVQPDRSLQRATQREPFDPARQSGERQRIGADIRE